MRFNIHGFGFTAFLAALTALPPLAIDMALPSLGLIQADFGATQTQAASAIAIFLAGFSTAPLVVGPLADRFGRKPVMLAGILLFTLCAAGCALAPSINALLAFRLFQGVGAGAVGVLPRAIIRDLFDGHESRVHIAAVSLIFSIAPLIAPTLGAAILAFGSWRVIYMLLTGVGAAVALVAFFLFDESHAIDNRRNLRAGDGRRRLPSRVDDQNVRGLRDRQRPRVRGPLRLRQCIAASVHPGLWRVEGGLRRPVRDHRLRRHRRLLQSTTGSFAGGRSRGPCSTPPSSL